MERPHALLDPEYRERRKQEQQFARLILFVADSAFVTCVADRAFADRTQSARVSGPRPAEARRGDQAGVEDEFARSLALDRCSHQANPPRLCERSEAIQGT